MELELELIHLLVMNEIELLGSLLTEHHKKELAHVKRSHLGDEFSCYWLRSRDISLDGDNVVE